MRRVTFKEGPFVFIRKVVIMEVLAAILLYAASFLENYELRYEKLGLSSYLRYDNFLMLSFSIFQVIYITLLFFEWYFSYFEVNGKELTKKTGLLFRRRKTVSLANIESVTTYQSPMSRFINHATIILESTNGTITKLKNIGNYEEYLYILKQQISDLTGTPQNKNSKYLLEQGESSSVEFKETLRFDTRKNEVSKDIERAILKTIVGFLNNAGGTLFIGVDDDGKALGLERDYETLPKKNRDGFENHFNSLIKSSIGLIFSKYIKVAFEKIDDKQICVVTISPSHKPVYFQNGNKSEDFYVRMGNSTQPLSMSEAEEYIQNHWGKTDF